MSDRTDPAHAPALAVQEGPEIREPLQARSRESFARVQDAALNLLREKGDDSFTLAEVSERSGVSTGSIYGRVKGKDALLRLVQARELERIDAATESVLATAVDGSASVADGVRVLVAAYAELLRAEAGVLRPFMLRAVHDQEVAQAGKRSSDRAVRAFCGGLLRYRDQIHRDDPRAAVEWCHTVVYSVLARRLGLGSTAEGADPTDLGVMVDRLASMVTSYLTTADPH